MKNLLNDEDAYEMFTNMMFTHTMLFMLVPSYSPSIQQTNLFDAIHVSGTT